MKIDNSKKAKAWIKKTISKDGFYLAIVLGKENKVIGYICSNILASI